MTAKEAAGFKFFAGKEPWMEGLRKTYLAELLSILHRVAAGTALWMAAEFSKGVVWIIGYLLPDHLNITKTPAIAAVFALTWTLATLVVEELIDARLPGSKR